MIKKTQTELVRVGQYAAEVDVELIYTEYEWSPSLSIADSQKLEHVRQALQREDIETATQLARVYRLTPVAL